MIQTTEQELQAIVAQLKPYIMEYIRQYSVGVGEIELATTLEGVYSLPALMRIGGVDKIVEVPVELLQVAVSNVVDECVAATQSANTAAQAATDAGNSASAVIADLEELKTSITQAISESATAIQGANTAKDNANTAAAAANEAADKANKAADGVSESISAANTAAQGANTAKENAETAAKVAIAAAIKVDSSITASRNLPKIQNGTWWVYDIESETYVDSGNPATGRSPKIQDGTWWVWNDETSQYANTGVSVNSAYELTKEKVENVLTGDITSHTHSKYLTKESDPTVPSWAKQATKPAYTASEVGALPDTTMFKTINNESILGSGDIQIDSNGAVDITDIFMRLQEIETGGKCTQEDYNTIKGYVDSGVVTYVSNFSASSLINIINTESNIQISFEMLGTALTVGVNMIQYLVITLSDDLTVTNEVIPFYSIELAPKMVLTGYEIYHRYSPISESDTILSAIEKLEARLVGYELSSSINSLNNDSTSEEISAAIGGLTGITNLENAVKNGVQVYTKNNVLENITASRMNLSIMVGKNDSDYFIYITGAPGDGFASFFGVSCIYIVYNSLSQTFSCQKYSLQIS